MTEKFYDKNAEVDKDGEKQDLGVYEVRKLIYINSYDDNWNLTRYTSELRKENDDSFFAYVDFEDDEGSIKECPHCLEFGFHNKLYARIRKDGEPSAPDDDLFGSCHECGNTVPIYTAHYESEIKDSLETVNNPFESSESIFLSTESRREQRRKGKNKRRFKVGDHPDSEVQAAINKYGLDNVRIIQ
jgi:hypothetical protein